MLFATTEKTRPCLHSFVHTIQSTHCENSNIIEIGTHENNMNDRFVHLIIKSLKWSGSRIDAKIENMFCMNAAAYNQ